MAVLGHEKIKEFIASSKILENFEEQNIQGSGVDLRIAKIYKIKSGSKLKKESRQMPEIEEVASSGSYVMKPGEYVLIETMEKVNMPANLVARMLPRSSMFRCGINLATAVVDPGYCGKITVGMKNFSEHEVEVEIGSRVLQIVFELVEGKSVLYDGKYQGGKVV
jgi:dUTP pyrophosphatase